jgi:hypothetical protein
MNSPVSCLPDPIQNMVKITQMTGGRRVVLQPPKKKKNKNNKQIVTVPRNRGLGGNAAFATTMAPGSYGAIQAPRKYFPMTNGIGRSLSVANYEQVGVTFTGTGGFTIGGSVINAGIAANFPWLSQVAKNYQRFKWKFLRYIYVPQCPSTTPGSVFIEMRYDWLDSAATTLAQVTATESAVVGNAWFGGALSPELAFGADVSARDAICLTVDVSRFNQPWYNLRATNDATLNTVSLTGTATGGNGTLAIASGGTFDPSSRPGVIYYGTNGITNALVVGNLYVSYICELADPILAAAQI